MAKVYPERKGIPKHMWIWGQSHILHNLFYFKYESKVIFCFGHVEMNFMHKNADWHLDLLLTTIALNSQRKRPMWAFCQLLSMSMFCIFISQENDHHVSQTKPRSWNIINLMKGIWWYLVPRVSIITDLGVIPLEKFEYSFLPII